MPVGEFSSVDPNVDYEKILPIHQKRMIAFINNFILNTVDFLNHFAHSCESRLMEFEYKVQNIEAALLILESQLSSITGLNENSSDNNKTSQPDVNNSTLGLEHGPNSGNLDSGNEQTVPQQNISDVHDPKLEKFFKMIQVGVPIQAVKNKMVLEGLDPSNLDKVKSNLP